MTHKRRVRNSVSKVAALVVDHDGLWLFPDIAEQDAIALAGCASEDPATWSDIGLVWPRHYEVDGVTSELELSRAESADWDQATHTLSRTRHWVAIDLPFKRLFMRRLRAAGEHPLAPWWECHPQSNVSQVQQPRATPLSLPLPGREFLWGPAMTGFFAARLCEIDPSDDDEVDEPQKQSVYRQIRAIHRDWLMTPQAELEGTIPRELLHQGRAWIAWLIGRQMHRLYRGRHPVPVPKEFTSYATAPMGNHEVILYFEACRAVLTEGWVWLHNHVEDRDHPDTPARLQSALNDFLSQWMQQPFEDMPTPARMIECERQRVPLTNDGPPQALFDDCPVCQMMADAEREGILGPAVIHLDGHRLELEDDFAFSLCATQQEWEQEQEEWAEFDESFCADVGADAEPGGTDAECAPFGHAGGFVPSLTAIPSHMELALQLAGIVSSLECLGVSVAEISDLSEAFIDYRQADSPDEASQAARTLHQSLQHVAGCHESLADPIAAFRARLDEQTRDLSSAPGS